MQLFSSFFSVIDGTQSGQASNYVSSGSSGETGASSTGGEEDGYSQAESSIKNGEVIASAQGTKVRIISCSQKNIQYFFHHVFFYRTVELLKHKFKVLTAEVVLSLHQLKRLIKIVLLKLK